MPCSSPPFRALAAARRGTVAVEFAFVGTALMALVVGMMHIGFCLYAQIVLDQAAATIARQFQTGTTQTIADPNAPSFKTISVCPALMGLLNCNAVTVLNYPVPDYLNQVSTTTFSAGGPRSTMLLKLVYTAPIPTWPVLTFAGSSTPMLITSSLPYVNEFSP